MLGPELVFTGTTEVLFRGEKLTFFGGNDYHRLSSHPSILQALTDAAGRYGMNCGGSRATTGNHPLYGELEAWLAVFLGAEAVTICSAGYLSSMMLVQAVSNSFSCALADEKAHASLVDSIHQAGLPLSRFRHLDAGSLADLVKKQAGSSGRPLVVTDGVFANSGAIPPLAQYAQILNSYDGRILVDDAHGVGVVGVTGKGSWEEANIPRECIFQTGTLSKGLGGFGGLVAGSRDLASAVRARSGAFIGSTPPPLPVAAASIRAIELLAAEPERIEILRKRSITVKPKLRSLGFAVSDGPAPICSVTFLDERKNAVMAEIMHRRGLYPSFINYPGCPPGGHFRLTLSSGHTDEQIALLIDAITEAVQAVR